MPKWIQAIVDVVRDFGSWCYWWFVIARRCEHDEGVWFHISAGMNKVRHCTKCGKCLVLI